MEAKIKWNEGDGYITATYEGSGSGSASIASDLNEGIDREQTITVSTIAGDNPKSSEVNVKQYGLREVFNSSDGEFLLADGGTINVLKRLIPEGFTEVNYLESTGQQYINTGFYPNQDTFIEIEIEVLSAENAGTQGGLFLYGSAYAAYNTAYECYAWSGNFEINYGNQVVFPFALVVGHRLKLSHNKTSLTLEDLVDGTVWKGGLVGSTFTTPFPMVLFGTNRGVISMGYQRVFGCKIYDNGRLIRDYRPVTDASGTFGMYDVLNKTFHPSDSGTNFIGE